MTIRAWIVAMVLVSYGSNVPTMNAAPSSIALSPNSIAALTLEIKL
jgi:hypothetical protein